MQSLSVSTDLQWLLGATIVGYVLVMYALAFWAQGRVADAADFLVAGRRLPFSLAWMTLLATWFGAGTCLLLAGWFVAARLWRMRLLTISDFFRRKFGSTAEWVSACVLVPGYFGWIAAQLVALAGMLHLFFGLDMQLGILLVAIVGTGYTLLGGMWSVTLTDALQISLVLAGLLVMAWLVLSGLGSGDLLYGLERLGRETPSAMLRPIPAESAEAFLGWLSVFLIGALGNLPGQDLLQRIFAAKSAQTARRACLMAGAVYLSFGMLPVGLGLAGNLLLPEDHERAILPALAHLFFSPLPAVIFTVALMSAVLSTIDSAILSPAGVLAQNVFARFNRDRLSLLALNRIAVLVVACCSLVVAYLGEDAYTLLEDAYELSLVTLFVPLVLGLYTTPASGRPAVATMVAGLLLWLLHFALGWDDFAAPWLHPLGWRLPSSLAITFGGLLLYLLLAALDRKRTGGRPFSEPGASP